MSVGAVTQQVLPVTQVIVGRQVLVAGAATVALKQITDNSLVFCFGDDTNVDGILQSVTTSGTGFVVTSSVGGDVGFVAYLVIIIP